MTSKYRIRNYVNERGCDPIWYTAGTHKFLQKSIQHNKNSRLQKSDCANSVLRIQNIIPSGDLALEFSLSPIFYSEIPVAEENNKKLRIGKVSDPKFEPEIPEEKVGIF
jgi:hypothetical protein